MVLLTGGVGVAVGVKTRGELAPGVEPVGVLRGSLTLERFLAGPERRPWGVGFDMSLALLPAPGETFFLWLLLDTVYTEILV